MQMESVYYEMPGTARAIAANVLVVDYDYPTPIPMGQVIEYKDGLALPVTREVVAGNTGRRIHYRLLYLSGDEYRGDRETASMILIRALNAWQRNPLAKEFHVTA